MPLDPVIANPVPFKINDPMEQYGAYLKNAFLMDEIDKAREEREFNSREAEAWKKYKGDNEGDVINSLASSGAGKRIPSIQKGFDERRKTAEETKKIASDAAKTEAETDAKVWENAKTLLDPVSPDPNIGVRQMEKVIRGWYQNPRLAKFFADNGRTIEASLGEMNDAAQNGKFPDFLLANRSTLDKLSKMTYVSEDLGGHKTVTAYRENTLGTPAGQQVSDKEVTLSPNRAQTNINVDTGGDEYAKERAKLRARADEDAANQAKAAPLILNDVTRGLALVPKAFTGYFSGGAKTFNAMAKGAGMNETTPGALQATQELEQILSSDMLKNIGTLRNEYDVKLGSVTEKEFAQLQSTIPRITDDPATITAWFQRLGAATRKAQAEYEQHHRDVSTNPVTAPVVKGLSVPPPPKLPGTDRPNPGFMDKRGRPVTVDAISDLLRGDPANDHYFDSAAGVPGLAKRIRASQGGTLNQGAPFPPAGAGAR
jgi:hypothetical protein